LNEVSTGGTLSSLFSILSLFTEDIKLSWDTPPNGTVEEDEDVEEDEEDITMTSRNSSGDILSMGDRSRGKSRQNSDVSQLDGGGIGKRVSSPDTLLPTEEESDRQRTSSFGSRHSTLMAESDAFVSASAPTTNPPSPILSPDERPLRAAASFTSPRVRNLAQNTLRPFPAHEEPALKTARPRKAKTPNPALKGTIARAKVDTTLAVIPAEAFRKLTKKYPKASGTVVQVVLERFSRVTFMTGQLLNT
jgi:lysophospholipid hydrolase